MSQRSRFLPMIHLHHQVRATSRVRKRNQRRSNSESLLSLPQDRNPRLLQSLLKRSALQPKLTRIVMSLKPNIPSPRRKERTSSKRLLLPPLGDSRRRTMTATCRNYWTRHHLRRSDRSRRTRRQQNPRKTSLPSPKPKQRQIPIRQRSSGSKAGS